jgi:hypothetical protein
MVRSAIRRRGRGTNLGGGSAPQAADLAGGVRRGRGRTGAHVDFRKPAPEKAEVLAASPRTRARSPPASESRPALTAPGTASFIDCRRDQESLEGPRARSALSSSRSARPPGFSWWPGSFGCCRWSGDGRFLSPGDDSTSRWPASCAGNGTAYPPFACLRLRAGSDQGPRWALRSRHWRCRCRGSG